MNEARNIVNWPVTPSPSPPPDNSPGPPYFVMLRSLLYKSNGQPPDPTHPMAHSYFAILISFVFPSLPRDASPPSLFLDTPCFTNFCSNTDFIGLYPMNQMFATQHNISTSTHQEINSKWQKVCPFVNYQNHKPNDHILPSNCIFLNHINERQVPIVINCGASHGLTPFKSDFITFQKCRSHITGLGSQSAIEGEGLV
eukprot:2480654-Ditylum_brightwellii.AAC.1